MSKVTDAYGKWLSNMKWNYIVTIRRHYKLNEFNIKPMIDRLFKYRAIRKLFFVIEKDRDDDMTHVHLLLDTTVEYTRNRLSKELEINSKSLSYIEEIQDVSEACAYVSKDLWKSTTRYDIRVK